MGFHVNSKFKNEQVMTIKISLTEETGLIIGLLTGHCPMIYHFKIIGLVERDVC